MFTGKEVKQVVQTFKEYYSINLNHNSNILDLNTNIPVSMNVIRIPTISAKDVIKTTHKLKPISTIAPDGIPKLVLKRYIEYLAPTLAKLFNKSQKQGIYPGGWKLAFIVPIHKAGTTTALDAYLNIEWGFQNFLKYRFNLKHSFCDNQHRFLIGKSVSSNLCHTLNLIQKCIVVYFDFAKVFD